MTVDSDSDYFFNLMIKNLFCKNVMDFLKYLIVLKNIYKKIKNIYISYNPCQSQLGQPCVAPYLQTASLMHGRLLFNFFLKLQY